MKYIIIPLFRIITLPIWLIGIAFVIITAATSSLIKTFYRSDSFRKSFGMEGYRYETFWHYIINKKTHGHG